MKIGFIGLGHMGNPMASNLIKSGHDVIVFDVVKNAMQALVKNGAVAASTIADVIKDTDVVITMLQTGDQVREICLGKEGIFKESKRELLYIDCSSIDISVTRELHTIAKTAGIAMLDAPVSGGVLGAKAGSLTFMVGGEEKDFIRARPLLEKMGKKIIHAGSAGSGQAAKICNNLILGISMIAVSEGFTLAEKLGLDAKKFFEISSNASGQCWAMTSYAPVPGLVENTPANNNYQPGFSASMMLKDLRLGESAAAGANAYIPLGHEAADLYRRFVELGHGELDFSAIIKFLKTNTKIGSIS